MKILLFAGCALLSAVALAGCSTFALPLTGNPTADAKTAVTNLSAVNAGLGAINQQLLDQILENCGFSATLNVALPSPVPTGNLQIKCDITAGHLSPAAASALTGAPPVPISQAPSALPQAAGGAAPATPPPAE
jgi:hypothetical protein